MVVCREVDLGPFKHKIDDGLELRKAAFECMDVLLERCKDCINMGHFITHLEQGLQVSPLSIHLMVDWHVCMSLACLPTCKHISGMLVYISAACLRFVGIHANMLAYFVGLCQCRKVAAVCASKQNSKRKSCPVPSRPVPSRPVLCHGILCRAALRILDFPC